MRSIEGHFNNTTFLIFGRRNLCVSVLQADVLVKKSIVELIYVCKAWEMPNYYQYKILEL